MPSQRSPRPRVLVAHCYPGGLGGAASRWSHGSRIWLEGLALSAADEVEATVVDAMDTDAPLPDASAFDAIIITGSPAGVYERDSLPWVARLESWLGDELRRSPQPPAAGGGAPAAPRVLGGCFGAQLIASALGGLVEPAGFYRLAAEELEPLPTFAAQSFARGMLEAVEGGSGGVRVVAAPDAPGELDANGYARARVAGGAAGTAAEAAAAPGGGAFLRVLESHGDCVKRLPEGAVLLARSRGCAAEVFLAAGGRALAVQGHPEFSREHEIGTLIWPRQVEERVRLSADEAAAALETLALPRHHSAMLTMLRRFLLEGAAGET